MRQVLAALGLTLIIHSNPDPALAFPKYTHQRLLLLRLAAGGLQVGKQPLKGRQAGRQAGTQGDG